MHYKLEDADLMNGFEGRCRLDLALWDVPYCQYWCMHARVIYHCLWREGTVWPGRPGGHSQHASRQSRPSGRILNRWALLLAFYFYT
jgi:hypothetical protein